MGKETQIGRENYEGSAKHYGSAIAIARQDQHISPLLSVLFQFCWSPTADQVQHGHCGLEEFPLTLNRVSSPVALNGH